MTDYNAIQRKRNIIVGGFVMIAVAAMLWLILIFGELPVAATKLRSFNVVVKFPSASGIQSKTPVYYCGYQIGKVILVEAPQPIGGPLGEHQHQVIVALAIDNDFMNIPDNVDFKVMKRSMGSSFVEITDPEYPSKTFLHGEIQSSFQGSVGSSNEFIPEKVQKKLEVLIVKIGTLAESIDTIVGDKDNQNNIKASLKNITEVTEEAAVTLRSVTDFTVATTEVMTDTSENLNSTLKSIDTLVGNINEGDGTLPRLLNDGKLYENLIQSTEELQLALEQIKFFAAEARKNGLKVKL